MLLRSSLGFSFWVIVLFFDTSLMDIQVANINPVNRVTKTPKQGAIFWQIDDREHFNTFCSEEFITTKSRKW